MPSAVPARPTSGPALTCTALSFAWPDGDPVLHDLDLTVGRGRTGLVGTNGSGKSTLLRLMAGELTPTSGAVHATGEVGLLHQDLTPHPAVTVPAFLGIDGVQAAIRAVEAGSVEQRHFDVIGEDWDVEERARAELARLGLPDDVLSRRTGELSGGELVQLGLARLLVRRPEVLLLDEPTNGLDPPQIRAMRGVLARYAAAGRTVVVSSHLLSEVEQTCSHVVVMHRGRVVLTGEVAELLEGSQTTMIGVEGGRDEALRAALLLGALEGADRLEEVDVDPDGRVRVRGRVPRSRLVTALVGGRVAVSSVDGRRHLEEVFMGLVGDDRPAQVADVGQPEKAGRGR